LIKKNYGRDPGVTLKKNHLIGTNKYMFIGVIDRYICKNIYKKYIKR